jgi:hypothetical protein
MRKKTSPRCSLEAIAAYKRIFPSTNAALEYLADGFPSLYTRTVEGLSGKFSSNELKLMIDAMNGALLTPWLSGLHIEAHISVAVHLDKIHKKWGVDPVQLLAKINTLSVFERACLEIWAGAFWLKTNQVDVDKYILPMVGQVS